MPIPSTTLASTFASVLLLAAPPATAQTDPEPLPAPADAPAPLQEAAEATPELSEVYPAPAPAPTEPKTAMEALMNGRSWVNFRYRYEGAELRGFPDRSWASTLRGAFGHETQSFHGFRALGEIEAVGHILNPSFNDTTGGNANRAPIPDPELIEINQLYAAYDGQKGLDARLGRQEIELGNQRFIGTDPWRQNHQSFDALRLKYQVDETLALDYTFAFGVNRVLGNDSPFGREDMAGHFLDVRKTQEGIGNFAAYAYLTDYDELNLLSTNTLGARYDRLFEGQELGGRNAFWNQADWGVALEFANQTDAGDNPASINANYLLIEGTANFSGYRFALASETLGGSGDPNNSFSTPLASLHWFNGYADQFQGTPDTGLNDRRFGFDTDLDIEQLPFPVHLAIAYHWFSSDAGSSNFGRELDLDVQAKINEKLTTGLRYADFNGRGGFSNANRFMAWVSYRLL